MTLEGGTLSGQIEELERWIDQAADGLLTFYVSGKAGFRRSTLAISTTTSATTSARALFAVAEYVRFLQERSASGDDDRLKLARAIVIESASNWVVGLADPLRRAKIRGSSDNRQNRFTDSHLLMALALLPRLSQTVDEKMDPKPTRAAGRLLQRELLRHLAKYKGGKIHDSDPVTHDFITLHAVRAIDAYTESTRRSPTREWESVLQALRPRLERDALAGLGYHSAHVYSEFDPAEVLFTAALLERCGSPNWRNLLGRALEILVHDQTGDGAWVGSRVVAYEKRGLLHVASYEIGLTLSFIAASAITRGDETIIECILPALERVFELVQGAYRVYGDVRGWANDRTRWPELLEGWATAIVLTFLLRYRDVLLSVRQSRVLRHYRSRPPALVPTPAAWPDLHHTLKVPQPASATALAGISDPSPRGELTRALRDQVLTPIMRDAAERPVKAGLILHGTPGTRKTTMVKELAAALDWPMVTLSPPDFLGEGGLDGFESAAARVFTDLGHLRRVVILFDECEDFFRPRPTKKKQVLAAGEGSAAETQPGSATEAAPAVVPEAHPGSVPETRTIGAFITAGMLPRLQDLRDARWSVFVLATNVGLDELDSAAIRPGRFDFAQDIGHPGPPALRRYIQNHREPLTPAQRQLLNNVVTSIGQTMPFRAVDIAAAALTKKLVAEHPASVKVLIVTEADREIPEQLY